jgi:class 3 adenylate cyclase
MVGRTRFAVVPARADESEVTSVIETSYSREGSIIVPPSVMLKVRTDAFVVVDVVDSSALVRQDDVHFAKMMHAMGKVLERSLQHDTDAFLKSTGDGFFACFSNAAAALDAGLSLAPQLAERFPLDLRLSIACHWGIAHLNDQGDRMGKTGVLRMS